MLCDGLAYIRRADGILVILELIHASGHSVKELSYTEDEEAMVFLEAVARMNFTVLDGKVTCVNVAFVPARPAGRVLSSSNSFLGNQM